MKVEQLRKLALSLPEVHEQPHFDFASFRVNGKIFITLPPGDEYAHLFVGEQERELALKLYPEFAEKLMWGKRIAGVRIVLAKASTSAVSHLVRKAWENKAPKRLLG